MPIINAVLHAFLGELDQEAKTTVRVLERVPQEHLDWTPHEKSTPLGRLAWHIASIPKTVANFVRVSTFDVTTSRPNPRPDTIGEIIETFRRNQAETRELLVTLPDEVLEEPFAMMRGETTMASMPKIGVVRTILMNHTYHHRGQLTVYLRLLDVPLPVVYGMTADER
jgi:uncharacterized damage-inducible protein DinB